MNDKPLLHLAIAALHNYGLKNAQLTRLGGASNTNFKVDTDDQSFVLRLHTSALHKKDAISSELAWLSSLYSNTTLVLPKPVANLNGELVTSVIADNELEILCTLLSWVTGKMPPTVNTLTDEQLAKVGSVMAQLHNHSQQFKLPNRFKRQTYDAAHFSQRLEALYTTLSDTAKQNELDSLKVNGNHIITRFTQLERKQDFGMIHADFHSGNYLLDGEEVHIIDFDRCGFGFYLYDLALALMELEEQQQQIFLQGYESVKPLPSDYTQLKDMFLCLANLDNLGFLVPRLEEQASVMKELPYVVQALRRVVEIP